MVNSDEILLDLVKEVLGEPKKIYNTHLQYGFNCPICDEDRHKGNLEVSLEKFVWHCWSCGISGPLGKLFDDFGNKKQKKLYKLLQPDELKPVIEKKKNKLKLPESFTLFKDSPSVYPVRRQAYNYLQSRGVTDEIIEKYKIGFCDTGDFVGRIIIPSFDSKGELNYFIARSWNPKSKSKYKNPIAEKDKIIFNESLIDWKKNIVLVEGAFDAIFVSNSIAMLGKHMSQLLFETLYKKAEGDIIIATDGDAWSSGVKIFNELNGGELFGRIKIVKLPIDKDICDLKGQIDEYYYEIK
jgi:DNA primase